MTTTTLRCGSPMNDVLKDSVSFTGLQYLFVSCRSSSIFDTLAPSASVAEIEMSLLHVLQSSCWFDRREDWTTQLEKGPAPPLPPVVGGWM